MVWFYVRGGERRSCETRLAADGEGYELAVEDGSGTHVEAFGSLARLLSREHELLSAWRAQGWRHVSDVRSRRPPPSSSVSS
jgi:hypothetical protein